MCGIEMALMDLAGKAYGVPAYMLCGGKFRDEIRMYCDTPNEPTGEAMGERRVDGYFTAGLFLESGLLARAREDADGAADIARSPAAHRVVRERASGTDPHPAVGAKLAPGTERLEGRDDHVVVAVNEELDDRLPELPAIERANGVQRRREELR